MKIIVAGTRMSWCRMNLRFRLIHLGDTLVPVDPATLPARLEAAGLPR